MITILVAQLSTSYKHIMIQLNNLITFQGLVLNIMVQPVQYVYQVQVWCEVCAGKDHYVALYG